MRNPAALGKRDSNHEAIAQRYRELGCSVLDLSHVGRGCPDLLIGTVGITQLVEVKTDAGRMSLGQSDFAQRWRGGNVRIVRSTADALEHVSQIRSVLKKVYDEHKMKGLQ